MDSSARVRRRGMDARAVVMLLALVALVVPLLTAAPAAADDHTHRFEITDACQEGEADSGFQDISAPHDVAIECLAWYEIALGVTETRFEPRLDVSRGEAATFLVRLLEQVKGVDLPDRDRDAFSDLFGPHQENIETLAGFDSPILLGFADGRFRPAASITRDQFASVVARTLLIVAEAHDELDAIPAGDAGFEDIAGNVHADNILRLAGVNILLGRTETRFAPRANIERGQTASVLARTLGGLVYLGVVDRPADAPAASLDGVVHDAQDALPTEIGDELAGAEVAVRGDARRTLATDADGTFDLDLPPGTYDVTVSVPGYVRYRQEVELADSDDESLDFRMYPGGEVPADSTLTQSSGVHDVRETAGFWVVDLVIGSDTRSAQEADQIVLERPSGLVLELGDAGTDGSWWARDGNTSNYEEGDHVLYYYIDGEWYDKTVTFDADGRLTAVNGSLVGG